jgi:hypothetical protein
MVFQTTQNTPTELEELFVERDVEADRYEVGFEDAGGSFVEVGRLENVADNVTDPVEIEHQNSGERIRVDSSGFETRSVTSTDSVTVTDGEATDTLHYGSNQDRANAGVRSTALGIGARTNDDSVAVGFNTAKQNTADNITALGNSAAKNNAAKSATAIGFNAGESNIGFRATIVGENAGRDNAGKAVSSLGAFSAENNTGDNAVAIGALSLRGDGLANPSDMGDDVISIGFKAGRDSTGDGCIYIGQSAGITNSQDDLFIVTDRNGNRRMEMDLANGDLKITGSLTQNASL